MVSQNSINNTVQDNDFSVNRSTAGTTVQSSVDHSDNTNAASHAKFLSQVGGTSGGDPHLNLNIPSTQDYAFGIDNSDADHLKITSGANPSAGSTYVTFDQATTNMWINGLSFDSGSNVMSNYTEGTWTPTLTFGGGSTGLTYTTQTGVYTRIGNVVHISLNIVLSNKGSSSGAAAIGTLPYTSTASLDTPLSAIWSFIDLSASYTLAGGYIAASSTSITLVEDGDNVAGQAIQDTAFANNTLLYLSGFYTV